MLLHLESLSSTYIPSSIYLSRVSNFYFLSFTQLGIVTTPLICNRRLGDPCSHSKTLDACLTLVKENCSKKLFQKCYFNLSIFIFFTSTLFLTCAMPAFYYHTRTGFNQFFLPGHQVLSDHNFLGEYFIFFKRRDIYKVTYPKEKILMQKFV